MFAFNLTPTFKGTKPMQRLSYLQYILGNSSLLSATSLYPLSQNRGECERKPTIQTSYYPSPQSIIAAIKKHHAWCSIFDWGSMRSSIRSHAHGSQTRAQYHYAGALVSPSSSKPSSTSYWCSARKIFSPPLSPYPSLRRSTVIPSMQRNLPLFTSQS